MNRRILAVTVLAVSAALGAAGPSFADDRDREGEVREDAMTALRRFLDSARFPDWFDRLLEDAFERAFRPEAVRAPERAVVHRSSFHETVVNGERSIRLDRNGTEYRFRVRRDGSIEAETAGRLVRHAGRESFRRRDPELFRVFEECSTERSMPLPPMTGMEDFEREFRRVEAEARRGAGFGR